MATATEGFFKTVLDNSRNISDIYYNDLALRGELSDSTAIFEDFLQSMRQHMDAVGGIKQINAVGQRIIDQIEQDHDAGNIAAVDGTNAIEPTESMSKTVYAVAVLSTTTKTLNDPRITKTESHREIPPLKKEDDFFSFIESLETWSSEKEHWVRQFREYHEREEALRLIEEDNVSLVLIDGPLYTTNLLYLSAARHILDRMQKQSDRLIGFIKAIEHSKVLHLAGMALKPGECWTVNNWRQILINRFAKLNQKISWLNETPSDWVRTVYRKNDKAFVFECHPKLVDVGLALVASPVTCSTMINHEIPFLLHCADRIVRARINADAKSKNLVNISPYYANLANERIFR